MSELAGMLALVTGASSGIGLAVARRLAEAGMDLQLVARDARKLEIAGEQLAADYPGIVVRTLPVDLSAPVGEIDASLSAIDTTRLSVLVHSAGAYSATNILDLSPTELEAMFRVNVSSVLLLVQRFGVDLVENGGQILLINSSAARASASAGTGGYAATKHAAATIGDALRDALNSQGVRVLSIFPGRTATPMQEQIFAAEGRDYPAEKLLQSDDIARTVLTALSLPRTAEVTEIAIRPFQKT